MTNTTTFTSMYLKLQHVSSSPEKTFTSPALPLMPYIANPTGPPVTDTHWGLLAANTTTSSYNTTQTGPLTAQYDYNGAMLFTVATVCVYGLSIVFFIAGHTQKRELNKDEERQISSYLKRLHLEEPSQNDRKFHVIRLKSQFLAASALGQRHNRRVSLVPRLCDHFMRRGGERVDDESDSDDNEHVSEEKASHSINALFSRGECRVQTVNEQLASNAAVPVPFRGRRHACVGFGVAAHPGDCGGEGPRDGPEGGKVTSARPPWRLCSLPSIDEDEISMRSLRDLPSPPDSAHMQLLDLEDPEPDVSPGTSGSPECLYGEEPQPPSYSESAQEPNGSESHGSAGEEVDMEPCGRVMVTRL